MLSRLMSWLAAGAMLVALSGCHDGAAQSATTSDRTMAQSLAELSDNAEGHDWPAYGRTFGEQHFSPLSQINDGNVGKLGLVWSLDLPPGNSVTQPLEVNGVIYFATSFSKIHAVDALTGKQLWMYDAKVPEALGRKLRLAWGSRGIAWWKGKIYTGTQDGRLIAIDAATGKPLWSVMTVGTDDGRYITGAPRVFDGKVIIGHGGADVASIRGYVTAYDAETGKQLWRFYTVPGNPADGFENKAMAMAAKTWFGPWWKYGGGGTVWNAMTYDAETDTIFLGTGNGSPWNRKIRSQGKGDNLFLCSIVALDAKTGAYKWHYQINPGESWDYNADMDMALADLTIDGKPRKVLMTAPKNGFLYVLDRNTGQFISAKAYSKQTWAQGFDQNGKPIDTPNSRYENGPFELWPSPMGAHSWLPMAFSKTTGLVYIPEISLGTTYDDSKIKNWQRSPDLPFDGAVDVSMKPLPDDANTSSLVALDPVTQKEIWRVPTGRLVGGGLVATAGNLVFQGQMDSRFSAYDAKTGRRLWMFDAGASLLSPPITYTVNGKQYVTVITGSGSSLVLLGGPLAKYGISYRGQARRVLTFALGGTGTVPKAKPYTPQFVSDPGYKVDKPSADRGGALYFNRCGMCHGVDIVAAGIAPDLRTSPAILSPETVTAIVHDGALVENGMPKFAELTDQQREDIRQFVRAAAHEAATAKPVAEAKR
jgi:quinohemoprotein ethanol dehydrogenase